MKMKQIVCSCPSIHAAVKSCNFVHIAKNDSLESIIHCPDQVVDVTIQCCTESRGSQNECQCDWQVYILTESGHVYSVCHADVVTSTNVTQGGETGDGSEESNQEIFMDLLNSDHDDTDDLVDPLPLTQQATSERVYTLQESEAILHSNRFRCPVGLLTTDTFVIVAFENEIRLAVNLFLKTKLHIGKDISPCITWSIKKHMTDTGGLCCMCMINSASRDTKAFKSSKEVTLSDNCFEKLFGDETALLRSPVILICPSGGSVFCAPVKSLNVMSTGDFTHNTPQMFYHSYHSIVDIKKVTITNTKHPNQDDIPILFDASKLKNTHEALVMCSTDGKCAIVTTNPEQKWPTFMTFCLPSPILEFAVHIDRIFHTTGSDLYETKLSLTKSDNLVAIDHVKPKNLLYHGAVDLLWLPNYSEISESIDGQLFLQKKDGSFCTINPKTRHQQSQKYRTGPGNVSSQNTTKLKDILNCLEDCSQKFEALKIKQDMSTGFMKQLNMASVLQDLSLGNSRAKSTKDIISVTFEVVHHVSFDFERSVDWLILCHVKNNSSFRFSFDWLVTVSISKQKLNTDSTEHVSYSFYLPDGLGKKQDYHFRLSSPTLSLITPITMETSLVLALPSYLQQQDMKPLLPVLIDRTVVDIIYGLSCQDTHDLGTVTSDPESTASATIIDIARNRPIFNSLKPTLHRSNENIITGKKQYSVKISVSAMIMESKAVTEFGKGCSAILAFITADVCGKKLQSNTTDSVTLTSLCGNIVEIGVCVEDLQHIITLSCDRCSVCAAMHKAVIWRLASIEEGKSRHESDIHLWKVLSHSLPTLEDCLREVNIIQHQNEGIEVDTKLLRLYPELRDSTSCVI